ncbi:hypothetical protein QBC34DRAFT_412712 [Podospora aff. communis PSN243]|uniref:Ysc84 actin-binding domain-containing protein n=1 Tax=Podospora aff. communis PSN243 TaxID=3040156 RepID=A0AAV9GD31_9PEZI|nr:hypothetical protein QBC34DRAFT_412712 [Podospora aff. communis PSN243]
MARLELDTADPPRYESLQDNTPSKQNTNGSHDIDQHEDPLSIPPAVPRKPTPAWQHHLERIIGAVATPMNAIAVRRGTNSFVPESAAKELWKATKILEGFTLAASDTQHGPDATKERGHELIPASSFSPENCTALLILTTLRVGLRHVTISTGSGILLVRRPHPNPGPDTSSASPPTSSPSWAPPVLVKTTSLGAGPFAMGLDVSDRVYVIKTKEGLDMLLRGGRTMTMGSAEGVVAVGRKGVGGGVGFPFGMGIGSGMGSSGTKGRCGECGHEQTSEEGPKGEGSGKGGVRDALNQPIQCYVRSAGLYCGVQAEGVMITERDEENRGFYGRDVSVVRGLIPAEEEENAFGEECKEGLNALRVVLARAEAGREKVE